MSRMARRSTTARVLVLVEVDAGTWSPDATMAQVTEQARSNAETEVRGLITSARSTVRFVKIARVDVTAAEEP